MKQHFSIRTVLTRCVIVTIAAAFFVAGYHPIVTFDTFFGLRIGSDILKTGRLPFTEIYSWAAYGRHWIPYEWLAQVWVALLNTLGGLTALEIYVSASISLCFLLSFYLFYRVLARNFLFSTGLAVFLTSSIYEFIVARPQTIAYLCLLTGIILILDFLLRGKNRLILLVPVAYLWTNCHASFVILTFFVFAYSFVVFLRSACYKPTAFPTMALWGVLTIFTTILPPLWFNSYKFLLVFTNQLGFMTQFVSEWRSLGDNPTYQVYYVVLFSVTVIMGLAAWMMRRLNHRRLLTALPLMVIAVASFQALRHVPLGVISCLTIIGLISPSFEFRAKKILLIVIPALLMIISVFFIADKRSTIQESLWSLPNAGIEKDMYTLTAMKLQGHMFNEFALGGYLLSALPTYQVFFDGRADIYACCEMRTFWPLILNKKADTSTFNQTVTTFLSTYKFSYMIIPVYDYNPLTFTATSLMADYLFDQPDWRLVYASDYVFVLVKNDGKNTDLYKRSATLLTPYRLTPYRPGKAKEARTEYTNLLYLAKSGVGYTGLGTAQQELGDMTGATASYTTALEINPALGTPSVGLGSVYLAQDNLPKAQQALETAITKAPYLGQAYTLLATVYQKEGDNANALRVLEAGRDAQLDFLSKQKIIQMLYRLTKSQ